MRYVQILFGFFAATTLVLSVIMLYEPKSAWYNYFNIIENDKFVSIIYGSALVGEFSLQAGAALWPERYLQAILTFMLPYKLVCSLTMLYAWKCDWFPDRGRDCLLIALNYFIPFVLIVLVVVVEGNHKAISKDKEMKQS